VKARTPDTLYSDLPAKPGSFAFDEAVTAVFEDMINRSVPGYQTMLGMLAVFARRFAMPDSHIYDLGCSLGASTLMLQQHVDAEGARILAIDNAPAMIEKCSENLARQPASVPVEVILADIQQVPIDRASLVVMNLILQFIPRQQRRELLQRIHDGMLPGGALLLMEKVRFSNAEQQAFIDESHLDFKRANGYSELEIARKRSALENFLVAETLDEHIERLRQCGFQTVYPWFSCLNFAALVAIK
jgi:tRNA (cmo5U34)-methyltransferase